MNRATERGSALLEVLVVAVLCVPFVGGVAALLATTSRAQALGVTASTVESRASATVNSIAQAISRGAANTFYPVSESPYSSSSVSYDVPSAGSDYALVWGETCSFELVHVPSDPDDGVDNNGNGLVDECMIVEVRQSESGRKERTVLVRNVREYLEGETPNGKDDNGNGLVDERGLCITWLNGVCTVQITIERQSSLGDLITRTATTSTIPRNTR